VSVEIPTIQPLCNPDGNVYAYVVPAGELDRLRAEALSLRQERDHFERQLMELLPKASAEEEAEMMLLMKTSIPNGLRNLIAELEAEGISNGYQ